MLCFFDKIYFYGMMVAEMNTTLPIDHPASAPGLEDRIRDGNFGIGMSAEKLEHLAIRLKAQYSGSTHAEILDMLRDEVTRRIMRFWIPANMSFPQFLMAKSEHTTDAPVGVDGPLA